MGQVRRFARDVGALVGETSGGANFRHDEVKTIPDSVMDVGFGVVVVAGKEMVPIFIGRANGETKFTAKGEAEERGGGPVIHLGS